MTDPRPSDPPTPDSVNGTGTGTVDGSGGTGDPGGTGTAGGAGDELGGAEGVVPPRRGKWLLTAILALALTAFTAWAGNFVLDYSMWRSAPVAHPLRGALQPAGLVPSLLVVWVLVLFVLAVVGRLWLSVGLIAVLTVTVGVVNLTKLQLRNDPVYPSDVDFLAQPGFLLDMVSVTQLVLAAVGIVAVFVAAWLVGRLAARIFPPLGRGLSPRGRWMLRGIRVLVAVLCLVLLHTAYDFNEPGNRWRQAFDDTGLRWRPWNTRANYQKNGFVAGLLYNMHVKAMKRPAGYTKAEMTRIAERYRQAAVTMNEGRTGTLDHTNVITILSESFSDPTWLTTVHMASDPIPGTTATMAATTSGKMLAPGFGGGTANVEFELLTGQSMSQFTPQLASPYEQLVPKYDSYPSAVEWLKDRGHRPIAVHPFSTKMYKRPEVFQRFGFDELIDKDTMTAHGRVEHGRFISDRAAFDEVLHQIGSNDDPLFLHLITMQNHMPYGGQYDDPIKSTGLPKQNTRLLGQYARGLNLSDQAFTAFLDELREQPEPTVVIFYGDHLPAQVYPSDLAKREGLRTVHQTPFLIWSNTAKLRHRPLPTTSPTHFLPMMFDALDVPVPPYYALLDTLYGEIPAMDAGIMIDRDDKVVDQKDLSPKAREVLHDYRLVQYDLSVGKRWSEGVLFGDPPR